MPKNAVGFHIADNISGCRNHRVQNNAHQNELALKRKGSDPFLKERALTPFYRMARKKMYFSSQKAIRTLGYRPLPGFDAVAWFREQGYLG